MIGITLLLSLLSAMTAVGCITKYRELPVDATSIDAENLLPRPLFEKSVIRPLGRILITWNAIDEAIGYELQESDSENFQRIIQNWTMSGVSIELPYIEGITRWYRTRSFTLKKTSRWSPVVRLDGKD